MKSLRRRATTVEEDDPIVSLEEEVRALRKELQKLNEHRFIKVQNSNRRMLTFMLMRGLALGLGTVIGASVLVSLLAFLLAQINFIPIIGEWAADFADQIEAELSNRQGDIEADVNPDGSIGRDGVAEPEPDTQDPQ